MEGNGSFLERSWAAGLWLILFASAIVLYFFWNLPLSRIASNLTPFVLSLFLLLSFTGFGIPLARRWAANEDKGMQLLTAAAFGLGLTGIFVYLIGLIGKLYPVIFVVWTLLGFLLFAIAMIRWFKPAPRIPRISFWTAVSLAILTLFLLQGIPSAVAPELTTDALEFHLLVPKIYLINQKIDYIPRLVESNYPSLAEYLYVPILGMTYDIVCKTFHFWTGILLLLMIARLSKRISPDDSSALAPALFLSMPVVAIVMGWAWNDLLFTFFVVQSLYYLLNFHLSKQEQSKPSLLLLAGVLSGLASCTKYTFVMVGLAILLLFLAGILLWDWKWKHLAYYLIPVSALSLMWFAKNLAFTGNPFYPFLNEIFRSPYWTAAANQYFVSTLTSYEMGTWDWSTHFLFPFLLTLKPRIMDVHIGILPLIFLPLAFVRTEIRGMGFLKTFVACYVLVWMGIQTEVRSLFSLLAVLCVIYAITLQRIRWRTEAIRFVFLALIAVSIAANFFVTILSTYFLFDPMKHFLGQETRAQYRGRFAKTQQAYEDLNRRTGVGRVLLVSIHNPFYLKYEPVFSSCCDPPVAEWISAGALDAREITHRIQAMGITHVIYNSVDYQRDHHGGLYSWPTETRTVFEEFLFQHCRLVARAGNDYVYEVP